MHIIASPHSIIDRKITPDYMNEIQKLISEKEVEALVVGLPLTLRNNVSKQTQKVQLIIKELNTKLSLPIHTVDERLSSVSAEDALKLKGVKTGHNKGEIDKTAAAIFLQEFLDSK
jgi:putative Holliday junction resolvase